jgi:hypothetical protein
MLNAIDGSEDPNDEEYSLWHSDVRVKTTLMTQNMILNSTTSFLMTPTVGVKPNNQLESQLV